MSADPQSLEDLMEEYSTIPDYENVPSNAIIPQYLTVRLWLHQMQPEKFGKTYMVKLL